MLYTTMDPPKCQIFEPTTMHYTTIDLQKSKIRTHDMLYTTMDPPKCQIFEPTTMHFTTIDPQKTKI
jgi:hypothetical protein